MKATVAMVMALLLVLSVPFDSFATQRIRCDVCAAHGLSQAVVFGTIGTLRQFHARLQTGEARSTDAQAVVTSLRILFAHLDETGTTKAVEQALLAKEEQIIRYSPTRSDAETLQKHHATFGLKRTVDEELAGLEVSTVNDRLQALEQIKAGGLRSFYAQVLTRYEGMQTKLLKAEQSRRPPLEKVWIKGCDYDKVAAIFAIGCAFGCAGCCVVAAFARLFQALECGN
jgi:hypothetical protein